MKINGMEPNLETMCLVRMSIQMWKTLKPEIDHFFSERKDFLSEKLLPGIKKEWRKLTVDVLHQYPHLMPKSLKREFFYVATQIGYKIFMFYMWLIKDVHYKTPPLGLNLEWTWYGTIDKEKTMISSSHYSCAKMRLFLACDMINLEYVHVYWRGFQLPELQYFFLENMHVWYCVRHLLGKPEDAYSFIRHNDLKLPHSVGSEQRSTETIMFQLSLYYGKPMACEYFWDRMSGCQRKWVIQESVHDLWIEDHNSDHFHFYKFIAEDAVQSFQFLFDHADLTDEESDYAAAELLKRILGAMMLYWPRQEILPLLMEHTECCKVNEDFSDIVLAFLLEFDNDVEKERSEDLWNEDSANHLQVHNVLRILGRAAPEHWKFALCDIYLLYYLLFNFFEFMPPNTISDDGEIQAWPDFVYGIFSWNLREISELGGADFLKKMLAKLPNEKQRKSLWENVSRNCFNVILKLEKGDVYVEQFHSWF